MAEETSGPEVVGVRSTRGAGGRRRGRRRADSYGSLLALVVAGAVVGALAATLLVGRWVAGAGVGIVVAGVVWFAFVLRAYRADAAAVRASGRHRRGRH